MNDQLKQALAAVKNGEEVRARAIVAGLLKDQPDNIAGWVLLSKLAENEVQKAAFLHKVIALDPDNEYATVELSVLEGEEEVVERTEPVVAETEAEEGEPVIAAASAEEMTPELAPDRELPDRADEAPAAVPTTELPTREVEAEETEEIETPRTPPTAPAVSEQPEDHDTEADEEMLPPWLEDDEAVAVPKLPGEPSREETAPPADLPDWLQEEPEEQWTGEVEADMPLPATEAETEPLEPRAKATRIEKPDTRVETKSESSISWVTIGLGILLILIFLAFIYALLTLI